MSIKLKDFITGELAKIDYTQAASETATYPTRKQLVYTTSIVNTIPIATTYSTSDAFYEAVATGLQLYFEYLSDQWKKQPALTVGVVATVPPLPLVKLVKCRVNVPAKDANPVTGSLGYPTLSMVLKKAMQTDNNDPDVFYNGLFDGICTWINSVWSIQVIDPITGSLSRPLDAGSNSDGFSQIAGLGIIFYPAAFLMGLPASLTMNAFKPDDIDTMWCILSNFIAVAMFANISTPIPTVGVSLAPAGAYAGLTIPLPLIDYEYSPSLPPRPDFPDLPGITLPKLPSLPSLPSLPDFEWIGLPGYPNFEYLITKEFWLSLIDLSVSEFIIALYKRVLNFDVKFPLKLSDLPDTLGVSKFPVLCEEEAFEDGVEFELCMSKITADINLIDLLKSFGLTLPEMIIAYDIFNIPTFELPELPKVGIELPDLPLPTCSDILIMIAISIALLGPALDASTGETDLTAVLATCADSNSDFAKYDGPLTLGDMGLSATIRNKGFTSANDMAENRAITVGREYYQYVDMGNSINISIPQPVVIASKKIISKQRFVTE